MKLIPTNIFQDYHILLQITIIVNYEFTEKK
jgi:hypothetical protein